jgi:GGDEF domain-containing protein
MAARKPGRLTRYASLSVCRLPQLGGRISCALSLGAPVGLDQAVARTGGLMNRETFAVTAAQMLEEAERAGLPLRLDLVELAGLAAKLAGLEPEAADQARRRIAATLRAESYAGLGAAEIAQDRFALVRSAHASTERLAARVNETAGPPLKAEIADAAFEAAEPEPAGHALCAGSVH